MYVYVCTYSRRLTCIECSEVKALLPIVLREEFDEAGVREVELSQLARRPALTRAKPEQTNYTTIKKLNDGSKNLFNDLQ